MCPHGLSLGHLLLDMMMALPFITGVVYYIKSRKPKKLISKGNWLINKTNIVLIAPNGQAVPSNCKVRKHEQ